MESSLLFLGSTTLLANCTNGVIPLIKFFWNDWKEHSRLLVLSWKSSHNSGSTRAALRKSQFSGRRYFFWIEEKSPMFAQGVSIPVDQLIWRNWQKIAKIANFVNFTKIANVHPRSVNTSGLTNLTKLAKDRQNWQFCQTRQNRQCSPMGCQYQWMN